MAVTRSSVDGTCIADRFKNGGCKETLVVWQILSPGTYVRLCRFRVSMLYGVCNAYLSGHGSIVQVLIRAYATASQGEVVKVGVRVCGTVYARGGHCSKCCT